MLRKKTMVKERKIVVVMSFGGEVNVSSVVSQVMYAMPPEARNL